MGVYPSRSGLVLSITELKKPRPPVGAFCFLAWHMTPGWLCLAPPCPQHRNGPKEMGTPYQLGPVGAWGKHNPRSARPLSQADMSTCARVTFARRVVAKVSVICSLAYEPLYEIDH
jgi:hypothetical protein